MGVPGPRPRKSLGNLKNLKLKGGGGGQNPLDPPPCARPALTGVRAAFRLGGGQEVKFREIFGFAGFVLICRSGGGGGSESL